MRFEAGRPVIALPQAMTMQRASSILHKAMQGDGIEAIHDDGAVRMGATEAEIMREHFGYDCPVLYPEEAEERGRELLARFDACVTAHRNGKIRQKENFTI